MQIIQEGAGQQHTCTGKGNGGNGCGAILGVTKEDIFYTSRMVSRESPDYFLTIRCVRCSVETDIAERTYKPEDYPSKAEWLARQEKQ